MYALTEHIRCSVNVNQDKWLILLLKSTMFWLIFCLLVLSMNERSLLNPLTIITDLPISPSSSTREVSSAVILFAWKSTSSVWCGAKRLRPPSLSSGPLKMRVKSIANVSPGCWHWWLTWLNATIPEAQNILGTHRRGPHPTQGVKQCLM